MSASRLPLWFRNKAISGSILLVIGAVYMQYGSEYYQQRWEATSLGSISPLGMGEGLVVQANGLGYYAWLRSMLIDQDWEFDNEFDEHRLFRCYVPPPQYRTALGRRANQWSVGPACIWAVAVVPGHFTLRAIGQSLARWPTDGYSFPYQLLVGLTSLLVAFCGVGFIYRICRTQARPSRAALATAMLTLGSTIVYFSAIQVSLPHGLGTAVLAGAVWYWLTTYGSVRPLRWFLVGAVLGTAAIVRWQLATFAVLPTAEALRLWWTSATLRGSTGGGAAQVSGIRVAGIGRTFGRGGPVALTILAGAGGLLAFLPQMIAWRCVYGAWLVNPIQGITYHWFSPWFWTVLCCQDRSLFYWTPLTLIAYLGAILCLPGRDARSDAPVETRITAPKSSLRILASAFVIQVYVIASMWGQGEFLKTSDNYAGVFLSDSYGFRDLTESLVALAPGLAWLLENAGRKAFWALTGSGLLLVTWNLVLIKLYLFEMIPVDRGVSVSVLLKQTIELVGTNHFAILQAVQGPLLIGSLPALADAGE